MNGRACFGCMLFILHKYQFVCYNNPISHPKLCADLSSQEGASQVALWVASPVEAYQGEAFPGPSCVVASQEEACDLHVPGENFEVKRKGIHCSFNVQTSSLVIKVQLV